MFHWRSLLFLAILFLLAAYLGVPNAFANHEIINIVLQPPKSHVYVHGDQVTTSITIQTGPHFFGHTPVNDKNETQYFVVYKDKLADHPDIPTIVENRTLFVPLNSSITNNYTRPLTEGFWLLTAEVYEDDVNGEKLLQTPWQKTIVVQSELYPVFLTQTDATVEAAKASADSATWSAVSAILGPITAIGGVLAAIWYERHKAVQEGLAKWRDSYHDHSVKIITAVKEWYDSIKFPYLYYENGIFIEREFSVDSSPLQREMDDHIKKYDVIHNELQRIQTETGALTRRVREIFTAPDQDSFQKIIVDKLAAVCPTLRRENVPFEYGNNLKYQAYNDSHVFYHVYNEVDLKLSGQIGKKVSIDPLSLTPGGSIYKYYGKWVASADDATLIVFSKAISDLCTDPKIIALVKEYHEIKAKLLELNDYKAAETRLMIVGLYTRILAGDNLEGHDVCPLCPQKPKLLPTFIDNLLSIFRRHA